MKKLLRSFEAKIQPNKLSDIKCMKSEKNYTVIFFRDQTEIKICYNLGLIENQPFISDNFIRVHYSYIINLHFLKIIHLDMGFLRLEPDLVIPISNKYKVNIISKANS